MRLHSRAAATVLLAPLVVVSSMAPDTRDAAVASPSAIIPTEYLEVTSLPFSTAGTPARAEPLPRGASLRGRLSPEPSDAPPEAVPAPEQAAPSPAPAAPGTARPAPAAPSAAANVAPPAAAAPAARATSVELRMLALINGSRAQGGLAPYALDAGVSAVARRHSGFEASLGYVYHDGPDGTAAGRDGAACGSGWFGENVGAVGNGNVDALHWQYMAEPWAPIDHRTNIMDATFKRVGIGAVQGASALYMTMVFCR